jgi:hypothetical protein
MFTFAAKTIFGPETLPNAHEKAKILPFEYNKEERRV